MLILLPPSEGKSAARRGKSLDLQSLHFGELTDAREAVLTELIDVAQRPDATKILKVPDGLGEVVRANTLLREVPTAAAAKVYTGVLYDALDVASLDAAARRRMARRVVVFSALFGLLRMGDRIPAYRLSGSVSLPRIGPLARFWRSHLDGVLPTDRLVVDCRSSTYAAMWAPPADNHFAVRVFREADGERTVVSHMAKHSRGLVARALCEADGELAHPGELVDLLNDHFGMHEVRTATGVPLDVRVELGDHTIDVITS